MIAKDTVITMQGYDHNNEVHADFDGYLVNAGAGNPKNKDFNWVTGNMYVAVRDIPNTRWLQWRDSARKIGITLEVEPLS